MPHAETARPFPFRADHVGSLLRPPELLAARTRWMQSAKTPEDHAVLRAVEDDAIRALVKGQEEVGLQGITDGEMRRTYFHVDFHEQLAGVVTKGEVNVKFHTSTGTV